MNYHEIQKKVEEIQDKLLALGFPQIRMTAEIKKLGRGCAGRAYLGINCIHISPDYLKEFPEHVMNVTVPHEVVHLYVAKYFPRAKQAHGPEFRRLMRCIGLSGDTYHKMILSNAPPRQTRLKIRYMYITERTQKLIGLTPAQHQKAINGATFMCKGERLKFTNEKKEYK
jgi:predicted SprT family Zn-dependent metalloprotease